MADVPPDNTLENALRETLNAIAAEASEYVAAYRFSGDVHQFPLAFLERLAALPRGSAEPTEDTLAEALRIAEVSLHSWAILNTHTDPRESQQMGQRALDRFRAALLASRPVIQPEPEEEQ